MITKLTPEQQHAIIWATQDKLRGTIRPCSLCPMIAPYDPAKDPTPLCDYVIEKYRGNPCAKACKLFIRENRELFTDISEEDVTEILL